MIAAGFSSSLIYTKEEKRLYGWGDLSIFYETNSSSSKANCLLPIDLTDAVVTTRVRGPQQKLKNMFGEDDAISTFDNRNKAKEHDATNDDDDDDVVQIDCGEMSCAVVIRKGRCFLYGNLDIYDGILDNCKIPVQSISLGRAHFLFLDNEANCYGVGLNDFGQLGFKDLKERTFPAMIDFGLGNRIKKISCGSFHSGVVDVKQNLYMFGYSQNGRLGVKGNHAEPCKIDFNSVLFSGDFIVDVWCVCFACYFSVCLSV